MNSAEENKRIVTITRLWLQEFNNFKEHYDQIEKGYNFLAGVQYDTDQLKWFDTVRRPARVFNIVFPTFNQVLGDFLLNDQQINVYAMPGGIPHIADIFKDLIDHANIQNDSKSVLSEYALAGLIKMGYIYPRFSDEKELDGSLVFNVVDEFEVLFDSTAKDYFLDDAKYMARSRWLDKEQILELFPSHRSKLKQYLVDRYDFVSSTAPDDQILFDNMNVVDEKDGKYRLIEWHEKSYQTVPISVDPNTGQSIVFTLEGKKADLYRRLYPEHRIINRRDEVKTITTIIPALNYLIEEKRADIQDRSFDIIPYSAYNYGKKTLHNFGIFKNAVGPQEDYNDWANKSHQVIDKTLDPGYSYIADYLENPNQVELAGNKTGINFMVKPGYRIEEAIQRNDTPKMPFAAEQLNSNRGEMFQKIVGVTPNMMGIHDTKQENASLFVQRVKQGNIQLQTMYNNFSRSKRRMYNKSIRIIQENYTSPKFFMIVGAPEGIQQGNQVQAKNLLNEYGQSILTDIKIGRYKIIADDQDRNPTARYMRFLQKGDVIDKVLAMFAGSPLPPQGIVAILDWWMKESDLGDIGKLIDAFAQMMQQQQAQMAEQGQKQDAYQDVAQLLQLAQQKTQMENQGKGD